MKKKVYYDQVEELFIPVQTPAEAKVVDRINGREAKRILSARKKSLERAGSLAWHQLPDSTPLLNELERELFGMLKSPDVVQKFVLGTPRIMNVRVG